MVNAFPHVRMHNICSCQLQLAWPATPLAVNVLHLIRHNAPSALSPCTLVRLEAGLAHPARMVVRFAT